MRKFCFFIIAVLLGQVCFAESTSQHSESKEKTVSLDYPNMEIKAVLREVADLFELNVVIPDTLHGRTSIKMHEVTWKQIYHSMLAPVNYTWVEEGPIVKIIPIKNNDSTTERELPEWQNWLEGSPWVIGTLFAIWGLCHLALFIGVLRDTPPQGPHFAPKLVWAILVLVGGVFSLVGYWIIHHSKLRRDERPS